MVDMIDDIPARRILKILKTIFVLIIIALIGGVIIYKLIIYNNTKKFVQYLDNSGYTLKDDGSYYKEVKTNTETVSYKVFSEDFIISKIVATEENYTYTDIVMNYKKDGNIESELQYEGENSKGEIGILYHTGTYKNDKFKCEIVTANNFDSMCNILKQETIEFSREIEQIIKQENIKLNLIEQKKN